MNIKKIIVLFIFSVLICACSGNNSNKNLNKDVLRVALGNEPDTLDPHYSNNDMAANRVIYDLYAGLMDFDQKNRIIPGLAHKYTVSKDGLTYTFYLRKKSRFSNGTPIIAQDFVFSWQRLVNPKNNTINSQILNNVVNANEIHSGKLSVEKLGVVAKTNSIFEVHLVHPDNKFLQYCADKSLVVLPEAVILRYGKNWNKIQHIVTSGPYRLKQHIVNGFILVQKNPWYWNSKHIAIENVKYIPYVDISSALDAYRDGEIDVAPIAINNIQDLEHRYPKEVHVNSLEGIYFLDFNMKMPFLANNLKLRQALSMAIDRDILVNEVLKQGQKPLYSIVTDTIENRKYIDTKYTWQNLDDKERISMAQKLYKEAGFNKDHPLTLTIIYNNNELNKKVMLAVSSMWKNHLGVNIVLKNEGWNLFLSDRQEGNFILSRDMENPNVDDVKAYLNIHTCDSPSNYNAYCNKDYDALLHVAEYNSNETEQQILYKNAIRLWQEEYITIPLFQDGLAQLVKPYIRNYVPEKNTFNHVQSKWFKF